MALQLTAPGVTPAAPPPQPPRAAVAPPGAVAELESLGVSAHLFPMRIIVLFSVALITSACSAADKPTKAAILGGYSHHSPLPTHLQLPSVPSGCLVRVYHIGPKTLREAPRNQTDWAAYLRAQGVTFPRGGFAAYFAQTSTLIVANTPEQLQLLDPF